MAASPQTMPAITKLIATAGPESVLATSPVSTKMPVPMITPTPKTVRSRAERFFLSWWSGSSVSRIDSSTLLTRALLVATGTPLELGAESAVRLGITCAGSVPRADGSRMPTLWGAPARPGRQVYERPGEPGDQHRQHARRPL